MQQFNLREMLARSEAGPTSALETFINRLKDIGVPLNMDTGPWLAGGSVRRSIEGIGEDLPKVTDFDLFFASQAQYNKVYQLLSGKCGIDHEKLSNDPLYYQYPVGETTSSNNVVYPINRSVIKADGWWQASDFQFQIGQQTADVSNIKIRHDSAEDIIHSSTDTITEYDVQLIEKRFYSSVKDIIEFFDFTICQFVTDGKIVVCGDFSLWDLGRKRLVVNTITFPVSSMRRMIKYANQGYYICNGSMTEFLNSVIQDPDMLESRFEYVD